MSDYLCEELIVEIFTRLPPKSLLRFRSVCKSLRSCIDSPGFIGKHTCRSPQKLVLTHVFKYKCIYDVKVAFCTIHAEDQLPLCPIRGYIGITRVKFPCRVDTILGSCNGILCLFDYEKGIITLWNPSIMRQLTLPDFRPRRNKGPEIGLGFDPITDDNKIVSIPLYGEKGESSFVYAMKIGIWRPIASPMPFYCQVVSRACHLNGVLHWVVDQWTTVSKDGEDCCYNIITFDLKTHVFGMIALPKPSWSTRQLAVIQGSLAVISSDIGGDSWIWVRRDASWSVVSKCGAIGVGKVLGLTAGGDLLLDAFREGLQVYNPKTGTRSTLVGSNDIFPLYDMDTYVESLHLLDSVTACEANHIFLV